MRYAGLISDDFVNGEGVCVSLWVQGCPFHCDGCHNPQTWDKNGGLEVDIDDLVANILFDIKKNGITRNFSILGGEPMYECNVKNLARIVKAVREEYPNIKIYMWSGYTIEQLLQREDDDTDFVLQNIDFIIDGVFKKELRDVTLKLKGSSNQRIINLKGELQKYAETCRRKIERKD